MSVADVGDAAQLVASGLQPRLRPAGSPEYAELVARYQADVGFRDVVAAVADGLGLVVLDVSVASGIVVAPVPGSPFELRLADYRSNMSADDRLLHGLVHVGIAAYAFPTAASLADDDVRHVSVHAVETYLRAACERLRDRAGPDDPTDDRAETEQAWRLYLRRQPARATADGRVGIGTTTGIVKFALERLASAGMATRTSDGDGGTYRLLERYRIGVRELAARAAYRELMEQLRAPAPSTPRDDVTAGG